MKIEFKREHSLGTEIILELLEQRVHFDGCCRDLLHSTVFTGYLSPMPCCRLRLCGGRGQGRGGRGAEIQSQQPDRGADGTWDPSASRFVFGVRRASTSARCLDPLILALTPNPHFRPAPCLSAAPLPMGCKGNRVPRRECLQPAAGWLSFRSPGRAGRDETLLNAGVWRSRGEREKGDRSEKHLCFHYLVGNVIIIL